MGFVKGKKKPHEIMRDTILTFHFPRTIPCRSASLLTSSGVRNSGRRGSGASFALHALLYAFRNIRIARPATDVASLTLTPNV